MSTDLVIFIYNTTAVIVFSGGWWNVSKLSDVLRYDPATDQWVKTGDLETPRYWHRASAVQWVDIKAFCIAASPPGAGCWSQSEGVLGQCTTGTECLPWLPDLGTWDGASGPVPSTVSILLPWQKGGPVTTLR